MGANTIAIGTSSISDASNTPVVRCSNIAEMDALIRSAIGPVRTLLDLGPGIRPQEVLEVEPGGYLGIDAHEPYVLEARRLFPDLRFEVFAFTDGLPFGDGQFEIVWVSDLIEHLPKQHGRLLIEEARRVSSRSAAFRSPLGFVRQDPGPDGLDDWGMHGGDWQRHVSGWTPDDFGSVDGSWVIDTGDGQDWFAVVLGKP